MKQHLTKFRRREENKNLSEFVIPPPLKLMSIII